MTNHLSVNHYICGEALSFPDFAQTVRQSGVTSVGITRAAIAEMGLAGLESCLSDNGLAVSSLNSAGYFTRGDPNAVKYANEEIIEYAARLEAGVLCVISGGLGEPPLPLSEAHGLVAKGLAGLAERAADAGVVLGLEPIYPGDILTKGCINSCAHGLEIIAPYDNAKLILDLYHSWWDRDLSGILHEQQDQVALVQLCNLRSENGIVLGRETLTRGVLDLSQILPQLLSGAYAGRLELELFDRDLRGRDPMDIIRRFPADFETCSGMQSR